MIGVSIARSTRSGSAVGPGIWRKWRPTGREEFFDIASPYAGSVLEMARRPAATSDVGICRHEGRMRESVKPLLHALLHALRCMPFAKRLVAHAVHSLPASSCGAAEGRGAKDGAAIAAPPAAQAKVGVRKRRRLI